MSAIGERQPITAENALRLELPSGWRLLDVTTLTTTLESSEVSKRLVDRAGVGSAEAFLAGLPRILDLLRASGVLLTAVRARQADAALDMFTLALPGTQADALATHVRDADAAGPSTSDRRLFLSRGEAIERRTASAWGGDTSLEMPSRVQLIFTIPPTQRGAILSMFSTRAGDESVLASVAREVAESVALLPTEGTAEQQLETPKQPGGQHG